MNSLLVVLVGSNPLPNYIAACALRPDKAALVFTRETSDAKDRLKTELRRALGSGLHFVEPDPFIEDATCATAVRRTIESVLAQGGASSGRQMDASLNYTGGTKVMAVHARMAFAECGGRPECASYLDEGGEGTAPRLRFDDGRSTTLADCGHLPFDLRTLLALHGIQQKPRTPSDAGPTVADAREILSNVLRDVGLAGRLYEERRCLEELKRPRASTAKPFNPGEYGLSLSIAELPVSAEMDRKAFEQWYKFIGGEWLEEWVAEQLRQLSLAPAPEIVIGVNAFRGETRANLEVDVAVVRGHRSYFISCTTDTTKAVCKSKLFEVSIRSRQLGGDLARASLVCLADDKTAGGLQADIDDVWGANNTTRVFGLSDLRTWSDYAGKQPNLHSLQAWMES